MSEDVAKAQVAKKETHGFQSEVKQLLDLVVHSLYSNKEIFLRELISNASDAADKLRFAALSDDGLYEDDPELKVQIEYSKEQGTITVRDNGIGMSQAEVAENLGTIAKSGTREFFGSLTGDEQHDTQLIGQFGVGFYSTFIVAQRVTVRTRKAGLPREEGVLWESAGEGEYTIQTLAKKGRGTDVVLHLKDDEKELLDGYSLRGIVRKYSDHIGLPVQMPEEGEDKKGYETVNTATALWTRSKKDIGEDEYNEFYKNVAPDFEPALTWSHNKVEGTLEYVTLFFVPRRAPFDLWDRDSKHGVKLYVRRVFIMDDAEQLLPRYLRFVRGIVDSDDLPLNVSREILQQNKTVDSIRSASTKRILSMLEELSAQRPEDYELFWTNFGRVLKEGVIEDSSNQERIAKLLRFSSSHDDQPDNKITLTDYVTRIKDKQDSIYYSIADNFAAAKNSPHLEVFRANGIEVLLLCDPVDEWLVTHLTEFDGKKLKSVSKGELEIDALTDSEQKSADTDELKELLGRVKQELETQIKDVRITNRLTNSPTCLVADENDMGMNLQRIMQAAGQDIPPEKPIMEINPDHPLVTKLKDEASGERFADWVHILFDQALLSEGGRLEDPAAFVHRLNRMLLELTG